MFITPAVAGDEVYVGSCAGTFYAMDAGDGTVIWRHETAADGPSAQFHGDAVVTEDLVVVGSDARPQAHLYAFERDGGEVRWKVPFPGGVTAQVLRHGDRVLAVAASAEVAAFDLASGNLEWIAEGPEAARGGRNGDPALAGDRLFVPWSGPGVVDAYDAATGELLWRRELGVRLNTSVALHAGEVVVGGLDGAYHRLSPRDGRSLGSFAPGAAGGVPYGDLVAAPDCVLGLRAEGGIGTTGAAHGPFSLSCMAPNLEEIRWQVSAETQWSTHRPLVRKGRVIVGGRGFLRAIALDGGEILWERELEGVPRGIGASEDRLYVGNLDGRVTALPW